MFGGRRSPETPPEVADAVSELKNGEMSATPPVPELDTPRICLNRAVVPTPWVVRGVRLTSGVVRGTRYLAGAWRSYATRPDESGLLESHSLARSASTPL